MASDLAIVVRDLGKTFDRGFGWGVRTLAEALTDVLRGAARRPGDTTFWALRDISFEVERGTVLGVIGRNGAGKSTLLKIVSRLTPPTRGRVEFFGRVGSLLEVGTGFHPELSGRENIFLNGTMLGMTRREIAAKLDAIVDFSEVGAFLETPVKRYSSGMYMRLAFAVAAHLEPDILLVDEILAVGDAAFQRKSVDKMHEAAGAGRTLMFVSHNLATLERLCSRALWLDGGRLRAHGPASEVISAYLASQRDDARYVVDDVDDSRTQLRAVSLLDASDQPVSAIRFGEPFSIAFQVWLPRQLQGARYVVRLSDARETPLTAANTVGVADPALAQAGLHELTVRFAVNVLVPGSYAAAVGVQLPNGARVLDVASCLRFTVTEVPYDPSRRMTIDPPAAFAAPAAWRHSLVG